MTAAERNKHLRELANEIAAQVARVLSLPRMPKCVRITRRRGRSYGTTFSVPGWAAQSTDYFIYYVAHEACHAVASGHGPIFRAVEISALKSFGLAPVYANGGAGPYVSELRDAQTGQTRIIAVEVGAKKSQHRA